MPRRKIYVETTIPSFYFETRPQPDMVARREWTRRWWEVARVEDELVTSAAVLEELLRGKFATRDQCLQLIGDLRVLAADETVDRIVATYIEKLVMPRDPTGDALHLAMASVHDCGFLATWNCSHLANASKFIHIRRVNVGLGLPIPALVTPLELLGVGPND